MAAVHKLSSSSTNQADMLIIHTSSWQVRTSIECIFTFSNRALDECKAHDFRYSKRNPMMAMNSQIEMMYIEPLMWLSLWLSACNTSHMCSRNQQLLYVVQPWEHTITIASTQPSYTHACTGGGGKGLLMLMTAWRTLITPKLLGQSVWVTKRHNNWGKDRWCCSHMYVHHIQCRTLPTAWALTDKYRALSIEATNACPLRATLLDFIVYLRSWTHRGAMLYDLFYH